MAMYPQPHDDAQETPMPPPSGNFIGRPERPKFAKNRRIWFYFENHATRILDGDTFDAAIWLTPTIVQHARIRIRGLWANELNDQDESRKARAIIAHHALRQALDGKPIELAYHGLDMYGRWVCDVSTDEIDDIAAYMIEIGVADPKRTPHTRHELEWAEYRTTAIQTRDYSPEEEQF